MIHICTLKYGTKYAVDNVNRLYTAIAASCDNFTFHCLTDDPTGLNSNINVLTIDGPLETYMHWNKMRFYDSKFVSARAEDEIIILDIDQKFNDDAYPIIHHPIKSKQFLTAYRWWSAHDKMCPMNGGLQKFKADDSLVYLWEKFLQNPKKTMMHYHLQSRLGKTNEAIRLNYGEQNYIYDNVKRTHEIIYYPHSWVGKDSNDPEMKSKLRYRYTRATGLSYNPESMVLINYSGERNDVH